MLKTPANWLDSSSSLTKWCAQKKGSVRNTKVPDRSMVLHYFWIAVRSPFSSVRIRYSAAASTSPAGDRFADRLFARYDIERDVLAEILLDAGGERFCHVGAGDLAAV